MDKMSTRKFDPEGYKNNVYEAFSDFLDEFKYEYASLPRKVLYSKPA